MHLGAYLLHATSSMPCPGWVYDESVPVEMRQEIDTVMTKHVSKVEVPGFNYWKMYRDTRPGFMVCRFTWDRGWWYCQDVDDLDQRLSEYYAPYDERKKE